MCDFGYLNGISLLLNNLYLRLQSRDNLVHNLFDHIRSLDNKLQVWKLQLWKGNFTHFSSLSECMATVTVKYTLAVDDQRPEFSNNFKSNKNQWICFQPPFTVHIRQCSWQYSNGNNWFAMQQWPKRKIQCQAVWFLFQIYGKEHFSNNLFSCPENGFPLWKYLLIQAGFSRMKNVKSKKRTQTTNTNLVNTLQIATSHIRADRDRLVKNEHCQISH